MTEEMHNIVEWYIPGPVDVREEVLQAMSVRPYGHRTHLMSEKVKSIRQNMHKLLSTDKDAYKVLLIGGSGTNAMEVATRSFAEESSHPKVLVASIGYFGDLWADIFGECGRQVENLRMEDGKVIDAQQLDEKLSFGQFEVVSVTHNETSTGAMNPLEEVAAVVKKYDNVLFLVDAVSSLGGVQIYPQQLGIDYLVTSTQKCLGVPPGLGVGIVSEKAIRRAEIIKNRGYTTDVLEYVGADKRNQTLTTPAQAQIEALDSQLRYIIKEECPKNRFDRHRQLAETTRAWANQESFSLFPDERYASDTVSCFSNTRNVNLSALQRQLQDKGYGFDPGYRRLNDVLVKQGEPQTFRIAHMGDRTIKQLSYYLEIISQVMRRSTV